MGIEAYKRGFFFSLDGILALAIISSGIILISHIYAVSPPISNLSYLSNDLIEVFSILKVGEVNNAYVKELISSGEITDTNNTILMQIGEFYVANKSTILSKMIENLTYGLIPSSNGLNFSINNDIVFSKNPKKHVTLLQSRRMISGVQKEKPTKGYVARSFALRTRKNNTLIVMGDIITSTVKPGASGNKIYVTYYIDLPDDVTIFDSYWFIESAHGTPNKFKAFINGDYIPGSDSTGNKLLLGLNSYLHAGRNVATVEYRKHASEEQGGDDGASHFVVVYNTSRDIERSLTIKPFGRVDSLCSIQYKKPVFVTGNVLFINVNLTVEATTVNLSLTLDGKNYNISKKTVSGSKVWWSDSDLRQALAVHQITYANLSSKYFWIVAQLDDFKIPDTAGADRRILDNSFVYVDHTQASAMYGYIGINEIIKLYSASSLEQADFYRNIGWSFSKDNYSKSLLVDSQFAWIYNAGDPAQQISSNSQTLYSHPPNPFIEELARFGYKADYIQNGTNRYTQNFTAGYGINPTNSLAYHTFLIRNMVSYGGTFSTSSEAMADAIARLNQTLGPYVSATEISTEAISVGGVPSLWGPSIVEVRVWQ